MKFNRFVITLFLYVLYVKTINGLLLLAPKMKSEIRDYLNELFRYGLHDFTERQIVGNPQIYTEYDFIIVGAGPAGCVLANRLSENPKWNILLIEAGGTENLFHQIPMMAAYLQSTASNWGYHSEPQKNACLGMNNNKCGLPRGKIVGGTSSINYMIYNRGNRRDFDRWAEAGNPGWSYSKVLSYFLKSENANLKGLGQSKYHNRNGPLNIEYNEYKTSMVNAFVKASKQAGHKQTDYNGESQLGVSYVQGTVKNGHRVSAAKAFINTIKNRKNLHIITHTKVTKVIIDPATKTAKGVQFINNNKRFSVKARKEVSLSAGTFNSPQLLMLSGIGPAKNLNAIDIPIIKELPVGKTLYDHMSHFGPTIILNSTGNSIRVSDIQAKDINDFYSGSGGRFSILGGVESLVFIKTPNSNEPADVPDAEIIFVAGSFASDEGTGIKRGCNLKTSIYNKVWKPLEFAEEDHFTMLVMHFHPKSKGKLWLHNRDPLEWPRIDPNYFSNPDDIETILHGIKAGIKIIQAPALQRLGARLHDIPIPGCEQYTFSSDDYWRCSIKTISYTLHHQVGTCKMGPESDPTSVVNHELKVHGINGLRVVDTSIIPNPPTAHTNAAAFMIGEKAADLIKNTWKNS